MDKSLKIHDWNASLVEDEAGNTTGEVEVSFKIDGIKKPGTFVSIFQAAKSTIESVENGESLIEYMAPLTTLAFTIIRALKKSK